MKWAIAICLIVLVCIGIFVALSYNKLIKLRNKVKNSWAHIDAQLQRRFDLIPNLVEAVKGYVEHEQHILENVEKTRGNYLHAVSNEEKMIVNTELSSCLNELYGISSKYPRLKANVNFLKLQEALTEIEEDISYARQFYNDAVTIYNNALMSFPYNIIANKYNFKEEKLFNAVSGAEKAPKIRFKDRGATCKVCGATISNNDDNCPYCGCALE